MATEVGGRRRCGKLFAEAVARNDGKSDLNEMNRQVHRLATELAAEQELETADARERMEESAHKHARSNEVAKQLREAGKSSQELSRGSAAAGPRQL